MEVRSLLASAGISRSPGAVDWGSDGTIAFGAGPSVALMNDRATGIDVMLSGHKERVNVVRSFEYSGVGGRALVSGSSDKTANVWVQADGVWRYVVLECRVRVSGAGVGSSRVHARMHHHRAAECG
jgi:hypothetical protein